MVVLHCQTTNTCTQDSCSKYSCLPLPHQEVWLTPFTLEYFMASCHSVTYFELACQLKPNLIVPCNSNLLSMSLAQCRETTLHSFFHCLVNLNYQREFIKHWSHIPICHLSTEKGLQYIHNYVMCFLIIIHHWKSLLYFLFFCKHKDFYWWWILTLIYWE